MPVPIEVRGAAAWGYSYLHGPGPKVLIRGPKAIKVIIVVRASAFVCIRDHRGQRRRLLFAASE